jgi:hypothetical protein
MNTIINMQVGSRLCGVMASLLTIGPKFRGFKPRRGYRFLMAIKISSTTSFGLEVKPSVPCRKILRRVNGIYMYEECNVSYTKLIITSPTSS